MKPHTDVHVCCKSTGPRTEQHLRYSVPRKGKFLVRMDSIGRFWKRTGKPSLGAPCWEGDWVRRLGAEGQHHSKPACLTESSSGMSTRKAVSATKALDFNFC